MIFLKYFLILSLISSTTCEIYNRIVTTLKYSKLNVKPHIVNGRPAQKGQVPYLVSIKEKHRHIDKQNYEWKNLCGGSIISKTRVLTAAHCFEANDFYYARWPFLLRVVAGDLRNDISHSGQTETTKTQWRKIKRVTLHRNFNFPTDDIALIIVNTPWDFTGSVDFILPARYNADYPYNCMSAGYGQIGHGSKDAISPILLLARIDAIPRWLCSKVWGLNMDTFICTSSALTDVAGGDSGGPLACNGTFDPMEKYGRGVLVGIVSGKNFDKTTLYTRVSAYRDWIKRGAACLMKINECFIILTVLFHVINDITV